MNRIFGFRSRVGVASIALVASMGIDAGAQVQEQGGGRRTPPTGAEIAAAAQAGKLDPANAGVGTFQGKSMKFTPAAAPVNVKLEDFGLGVFIGVLENGAAGDETRLPPGRYDIFAAKIGDAWHAYAEAGGTIVKEALRVRVDNVAGTPARTKAMFHPQGWSYTVTWCLLHDCKGGPSISYTFSF